MMSVIVEAVARAICQSSGQCKYVGRCNTGRCTISPATAVAAIAAMREPTEAMIAEFCRLMWKDQRPYETAADQVRAVYGGMIDAALREGSSPEGRRHEVAPGAPTARVEPDGEAGAPPSDSSPVVRGAVTR